MKKIWNGLTKDLWIVLLDILAVNFAYFLAVLVRFYVKSFEFRPVMGTYMKAWATFAPFYTVLCVAVFALFSLYGGMWRYAGINDMNRIIAANVVTALIQVVGTSLFIIRMPIAYYVVGAVVQFALMALIRFGVRIVTVEKRNLGSRKAPAVPALVVGAGESGRRAIKHLEDSHAFRPVAVVDAKGAGKTLDGVPVVADLDAALRSVQAVFVADPTLDRAQRDAIRQKAEERDIDFQDYTGYLGNLGRRVPLAARLELAEGPVTIAIEGVEKTFDSGEAALKALSGRYDVARVKGLKLELKKPSSTAFVGYEAWAQQYKEQTGEEVSFF